MKMSGGAAPVGLTRALFRAFLSTIRGLEGRPLRVRLPIHQSRVQWMQPGAPQSAFVDKATESSSAHISDLFPSVVGAINKQGRYWPQEADEITSAQLREAIRSRIKS